MSAPTRTDVPSVLDDALVERLRRVIALHCDPDEGSPFWCERVSTMGLDPLRQIRQIGDLALLGEMKPQDLDERPVTDFIPRRYHRDLSDFIVGQTGGTTGSGVWTVYRHDEFEEAFVTPFVEAARHVGFPQGERWLFVGPTGPHLIGKAARRLAQCTGSMDPFCVDFDARWAKVLPSESFAQQRYLDHVVSQAMTTIRTQEIGVLFTTPVILRRLAKVMTRRERTAIRGVHYGGMALTPAELGEFQTEAFPAAVHLSGYGNTLFGCCLELDVSPDREPAYFPHGDRLLFETVDEDGLPVAPGDPGRIRFTRLDETMLIVRMIERDEGTLAQAPKDGPPCFHRVGVRNPHVPPAEEQRFATGLY